MEDDSNSKTIMSWFLGVTGLGAVAAAVTMPHFGIWLAVAIIVLALLIFGAYFLYRRLRARSQSRKAREQRESTETDRAYSRTF